MTEVEQPPQNGIDLSAAEEDDNNKARPADIEQDVREMERRKRVEAIMGSKLFREELERIVDCARDNGNTDGLFQQLSDIVGAPASRVGSVFKSSNCMVPINDIRGVESMGYAKGEKILRCKLAAAFRLLDLNGWTQGLGAQITARLKVDQEYFLVNPYGLLYHEITASSLNKVDMQGNIVEQGTTNFGVNKSHFVLHSIVHAARPDIRCAIYIGCSPVVAIASLKAGLLPLTKDACVLGELSSFAYTGYLNDEEERIKLVRNLGPNSKVMLLTNHGALCCGETIEEAYFAACHIVQACETQLKLLPVGLDNLVLISEESRKMIYEQSRRPPEDLEKKFAAATTITDTNKAEEETKEGGETTAATTTTTTTTTTKVIGQPPKWRVGGAEFEALMRMLDNAGYRTGYIYRHPLIKSDPPKPKNDVELPPAVSSLGYLLEEEELFRQGIWKKGDLRKGGDRSRWLNSPNVYQKVEVLETGTPDPKKITKWVAEGSPTHSTPVRIDDPLQFVPVNTNPREFKRLQQQIKDNRRADKISAGPQSHILEGVTWDEANRIKDATVSSAGDHVVLMGAASKGIIQRGFQHNATVYKTPYAKNPFDNVTDDELNEYKRTVERKKKSIHGEYTDTDFSESEALSSLQTSGTQQPTKQTTTTTTTTTAAVSQSEPEDIAEHQIMRIQTQQAPVPSQPEVVLSDASLSFINGERSHTITNRKPPTGRDVQMLVKSKYQVPQDPFNQESLDISCHSLQLTPYQSAVDDVGDRDEEDISCSADVHQRQTNNLNTNVSFIHNSELIEELKSDLLFQKQKDKLLTHSTTTTSNNTTTDTHLQGNGNLANISPHYLSPLRSKCKINRLGGSYNAIDNSSYYSCCYGNNTINTCKSGSEYCSNIYDTANSTNIGSDYMHTKRAYSKSIDCQTPNICQAILESLRTSTNMSASQQDLIWSRPFLSQAGTPLSITPENQNTPRKARIDKVRRYINSNKKSNSPYRTLSHFGFNSPQREPEPDHKHIPIDTEPKKYVPLRRSVSCEEIFSSPRYLDLCEHCFEQIVRTRLRNLAENYVQPNTTPAFVPSPTTTKHFSNTAGSDDECFANVLVMAADSGSYDVASSEEEPPYEEGQSVFTYQLETVIEVEERDSSEDRVTNSTFLDRIARMNYSGESSNINFINTPHTVSSHISLQEIEEDYEMISPSQENISESLQRLHLNEEPEDCNNNNLDLLATNMAMKESYVSVTEIWDFANWLDSVMEEDPTRGNECLENSRKITKSLETQTCEIAMSDKAASTVSTNEDLEKQQSPSIRLLMNREERTRRKLEFQELWEDHVRCGENRELCSNLAGYSDTESAIDETHHSTSRQETTEQTEDDGLQQMSLIDLTEEEDTEIFEGSSLVIAQIYHHSNPQNPESSTKPQHNYEEETAGDQEDYESTSSRLTFSITEQNSSEEDLLFRAHGSTNIAGHLALCGTNKQIIGKYEKQLVVNETVDDFVMEEEETVDNLPGTKSLLGYKPSFNQVDLYENEAQKKTSDPKKEESANSFAITCTESEEFNDIVRQQYDAHSNVSENFEAIARNINFIEDHLKNGEILEEVERIFHQQDVTHKELEEQVSGETFRLSERRDKENDDEVKQRDNIDNQTLNEREENKENENEEEVTDEQFTSLERKILEKIEINQLSKSEKIFDKIENSIRNKMTPSKLELLIKEQALLLCQSSSSIDNDHLYKLSSTPNKDVETLLGKSFDYFKGDGKIYRRSQSLNQLSDNSSPQLNKLNKTSTPPVGPRKKQLPSSARSSPSSATPSPCSSKTSMSSNRKRRNFILENIRNASMPRQTGQIKRLQGNTQAIFGKNPFGPRVAIAVNTTKSSKISFVNKDQEQQQLVDYSDGSASAVYSFQSKLVKGSPRFWVSMSQSPREKLQQTHLKPNKSSNRKSLTKTQKSARKIAAQTEEEDEEESSVYELIEKTSSLAINLDVPMPPTSSSASSTNLLTAKCDDNAIEVTKVDAEINALGEEIQQIHPRLETYKRKLEDFGDRVTKCARNMDECVATQEEIANEQRELKERIILQQFTEGISCRSETFSLSETED